LGEVDVEVVNFGRVCGSPYFVEELFLGDQPVAVAYEYFENAPFGGCEVDFDAVSVDFFGGEVHGE
jgi:hypothetical protein